MSFAFLLSFPFIFFLTRYQIFLTGSELSLECLWTQSPSASTWVLDYRNILQFLVYILLGIELRNFAHLPSNLPTEQYHQPLKLFSIKNILKCGIVVQTYNPSYLNEWRRQTFKLQSIANQGQLEKLGKIGLRWKRGMDIYLAWRQNSALRKISLSMSDWLYIMTGIKLFEINSWLCSIHVFC